MTAPQIITDMAHHPNCEITRPDADTVQAMIQILDTDGDTVQYLAEHYSSTGDIVLHVSTHLLDGETWEDGHVHGVNQVSGTLTANGII